MSDGWGKLYLCTSFYTFVYARCAGCFIKLADAAVRWGEQLYFPDEFCYAHMSKNRLVRSFLQTDCDSLLHIDSDMIFTPDDVFRLRYNKANYEYDIVSALAVTNDWQPAPSLWVRGERWQSEWPSELGPVVERDVVGTYFTLIRRHVFEQLPDPWFQMPGEVGEDVFFSRAARGQGFRLAVDTSVEVLHMRPWPMGLEFADVVRGGNLDETIRKARRC